MVGKQADRQTDTKKDGWWMSKFNLWYHQVLLIYATKLHFMLVLSLMTHG